MRFTYAQCSALLYNRLLYTNVRPYINILIAICQYLSLTENIGKYWKICNLFLLLIKLAELLFSDKFNF